MSAIRSYYALLAPGQVSTEFVGRRHHQGYPGLIHGGIICSLLDAAMTHCLFSLGHQALTAELQVRFLAPAPLETPLILGARLLQQRRHLFQLEAELCQGDRPLARRITSYNVCYTKLLRMPVRRTWCQATKPPASSPRPISGSCATTGSSTPSRPKRTLSKGPASQPSSSSRLSPM